MMQVGFLPVAPHNALVTQWTEYLTSNQKAAGSSPAEGTISTMEDKMRYNNSEMISFLKQKGYEVDIYHYYNKGRWTTVASAGEVDENAKFKLLHSASSVCNPSDNWNRKLGVHISLARLGDSLGITDEAWKVMAAGKKVAAKA